MQPTSIVLVAIGGYGEVYLEGLLDRPEKIPFKIAGAVDPEPRQCSYLGKLEALKVPLFRSLDEFYAHHEAELAVISSPIHLHCEHTCKALGAGSHVLCEKPAAATVEEVDRMIEAKERAGRFVSIGFQWSFSETIQALKQEILSGALGTPRRMKSLCLWPRHEAYYRRNDWAGRIKDDEGNWILDSPLNNAMAHDLHNMLFLLGEGTEQSARPVEITAELYRANDIENFDTAAARIRTESGAEILFFGSHAISESRGPVFRFEFDRATVVYPGGSSPVEVRFEDGTRRKYDYPDQTSQVRKLWTCLRAAREGGSILCGLEAARAHTLCVNGARESSPAAEAFPSSVIRTEAGEVGTLHWVDGLADTLKDGYDNAALPSELGIAWSRKGRTIDFS